MARSSSSIRSRWRQLATSPRSPSPEDAAKVRRLLEAQQPSFRRAVVADARITARLRGEHHEFRSRSEAVAQIVRLAWITDAFLAQVCYRARVSCRARGIAILPALLHRAAISTAQVSIGDHVVLEPGVYLPHGQVVIDGVTFVGEGAVLRPFVTLGLRDGHIFGPHLEAGVMIGTGAKVFGPVRVGAGAQVGANAVVVDDVAERAVVVGAPARPTT